MDLPKHKKNCLYANEGLWAPCTCGVKYLNRPFTHWQRKAQELVIECLVRSAELDTRSIIGRLASDRLMELVMGESPEMVEIVTKKRDLYRENLAKVMIYGVK